MLEFGNSHIKKCLAKPHRNAEHQLCRLGDVHEKYIGIRPTQLTNRDIAVNCDTDAFYLIVSRKLQENGVFLVEQFNIGLDIPRKKGVIEQLLE